MGFSSTEELENAISKCKHMIKQCPEQTTRGKDLVQQLIQLRLKLHEIKVNVFFLCNNQEKSKDNILDHLLLIFHVYMYTDVESKTYSLFALSYTHMKSVRTPQDVSPHGIGRGI